MNLMQRLGRPLNVGIDCDNTINRWTSAHDAIVHYLYPEAEIINSTTYNVFERTDAPAEVIQEALDTIPYRSLDLMPGAQEAIAEMQEAGHRVVFVTAPTLTHPTCEEDKRIWLAEHFGQRMAKEAIIQVDKTVVTDIEILIDDHPAIVGANPNPAWKQVMFRRAYNRHVETRYKLIAWSQWREVIEGVA